MGEPTSRAFVVTLGYDMAWVLSRRLQPGPSTFGPPWRETVVALRHKVDDVLLRFYDEGRPLGEGQDPEPIEISITEDEAWMIDQVINFDGIGGSGTQLLLQVFRGFWSVRFDLPQKLAPASSDRAFPRRKDNTVEDDNAPRRADGTTWTGPDLVSPA